MCSRGIFTASNALPQEKVGTVVAVNRRGIVGELEYDDGVRNKPLHALPRAVPLSLVGGNSIGEHAKLGMRAQTTGRVNVEKTPHRVITDSAGVQHSDAGPCSRPDQHNQPADEVVDAQPAASARQRSRRSTFKFPPSSAEAAAVAGDDVPDDDAAVQDAAHPSAAAGVEAEAAGEGSQGSEDTSEAAAALGEGEHRPHCSLPRRARGGQSLSFRATVRQQFSQLGVLLLASRAAPGMSHTLSAARMPGQRYDGPRR